MPDRYGDRAGIETTPPVPEPITDPKTRQNRAQAIAAAIADCPLCDTDGYRRRVVCDHTDHDPINARGIANLRRIMGWPQPQERPVPVTHGGHCWPLVAPQSDQNP